MRLSAHGSLGRAFVFNAALIACAGSGTQPTELTPSMQVEEVQQGVEFTLRAGQAARVSQPPLVVRFERVEADSRCPIDVTCVWAGDAAVRVALQIGDGAPQSAVLHTHESLERDAPFADFRIRLVRLLPERREGTQVEQTDYRATFVLSADERSRP